LDFPPLGRRASCLPGIVLPKLTTLCQPGAEGGDPDHLVPGVEAHDDDAAGLGRVAVDGIGLGPHDLAAGADEEELLILLGDLLDRGDVAGLLALRGR
jgi:hypothetical protein